MKFKKGDLLTSLNTPNQKPVVRVERVTRDGVVHCVNLVACATMDEGDTFEMVPDEHTKYILHSRKKR